MAALPTPTKVPRSTASLKVPIARAVIVIVNKATFKANCTIGEAKAIVLTDLKANNLTIQSRTLVTSMVSAVVLELTRAQSMKRKMMKFSMRMNPVLQASVK